MIHMIVNEWRFSPFETWNFLGAGCRQWSPASLAGARSNGSDGWDAAENFGSVRGRRTAWEKMERMKNMEKRWKRWKRWKELLFSMIISSHGFTFFTELIFSIFQQFCPKSVLFLVVSWCFMVMAPAISNVNGVNGVKTRTAAAVLA